ncbi:MAG: hypothetical protein JWO49_3056 [Arthrobacter sp.]|jgi:hypothetical protein|nr:hypothetical protein [Arthrobacter sp.]
MNLELDPAWLRTSMTLWRDAVDMNIPIHDDFKVHFLQRRGVLLDGFTKTATAWSMLLNACKAEGDALAELVSLKADVEQFKQWAEDGTKALNTLALQETLTDHLQNLSKPRH